jgi:hypothetical protein
MKHSFLDDAEEQIQSKGNLFPADPMGEDAPGSKNEQSGWWRQVRPWTRPVAA